MKTNKKLVLSCLIIGGLAAFCGAGLGAEKKETSIARGDHTVTLRVGTEFTIRLDPALLGEITSKAKIQAKNFEGDFDLKFQWRKDTNDIPGATKPELRFDSIDFKDVASYSLVYWGQAKGEPPVHVGPEGITAPVHVGVFFEKTASPTTGTVSYPLGAFGEPPEGGNVICGRTFDRWKAYEPFDGPFCSPPSTNYPNTDNNTRLRVDTCSPDNGTTMDTGIQVVGNFSPPPIFCNDNANNPCPGNARLSRTSAITLENGKTYRVGIYYRSGTVGTATKVTFNYTYF
jgi:hypothetical protein